MDTGGRKWGRPYLNRKFFSLIGERMADDILLVMAKRNGRYIAGAINFIGSDTLYGRNWGCIEDHPFLHFEVCYHQAIDFAIAKGLRWSRRARRASTSWRAATGRSPRIRRIISRIRACAAPSLTISGASGRRWRAAGEYLDRHRPFRKGDQEV